MYDHRTGRELVMTEVLGGLVRTRKAGTFSEEVLGQAAGVFERLRERGVVTEGGFEDSVWTLTNETDVCRLRFPDDKEAYMAGAGTWTGAAFGAYVQAMPARYVRPYTPQCSVASAWERSCDEEGRCPPGPPCMGPCWDGWCGSCTFCAGGRDMENIWDVMEDMSVRIAHLTAEVFRLTSRLYWETYPIEAADPASPLYDDLFFTTETCFPAYREMLRCRSHGQDLMESDGYRQYIRDMVRGDRDDGSYSIMQFLEWRKRRFSMDQTGPMPGPSDGAAPGYTDDALWEDLVRTFPEIYS